MKFRQDTLAGQHLVISGGLGALGLAVARKLADHGTRMTVDDLLDPVADAFLFLCSAAAGYMTSAVLTVDGGCSLYPMD